MQIINLQVSSDHVVPIEPMGGNATVLNVSGGNLFYADNPQVTSSTNQGTITAGGAQAFQNPTWIRSAASTTVQVELTGYLPSAPGTLVANVGVPDGVTDNTSYLQALLNIATGAGLQLKIPGGTWLINHLTLFSNSNVDATGATFAQQNGVNTRMILNESLLQGTPGTTRDSNITWTGGTFLKGLGQQNVGKLQPSGGGLDDHCMMFGFIDTLNVKNLVITQAGTGGDGGTGGRYGCYVWNCTNFYFDNYRAQSLSQSVNQSTLQVAYSQNGYIRGVYSTDGDDSVALVNGNQVGDMLTNGLSAMLNVTIEGVYGSAPSNGVRIMPGSTAGSAPFYDVRHCAIRNVRVSAGARGGSVAAVYIGGAASGYPNLTNGTALDIEVSDVLQLRASTPAMYVDGAAEVYVTARRINNQDDSTVITIPTGTGHQRLKVTDSVWTPTITSGSQFPISVASNTCRSIQLDNCQLNAATTGSASVGFVTGAGGPGWLVCNNLRTTGKCYAIGTFASVTRIVANGINGEDANGLGFINTTSGATVTVRAWNGCFNAGVNANVITAGSILTNDSRLPGASGTQVLTAGAATVTPGAGLVSAASQIRLTNITNGGTVGTPTVSARSSTTFTITSSSGADTSTIFWEIVNS